MSDIKDFQLIELKDTITQLNIMLKTQTTMIESLQRSLDDLKEQLISKDQENANLKAQIKYLTDKLFGASSEKTPAMTGQLSLFDENIDFDEKVPEVIDPEIISIPVQKKKRKTKASYDEMFANIKTQQVYVDTLTDDEKICPVCNTEMVSIGHELIRTEVIYKKAELIRIEYIGTTYECPKCKLDEAES